MLKMSEESIPIVGVFLSIDRFTTYTMSQNGDSCTPNERGNKQRFY